MRGLIVTGNGISSPAMQKRAPCRCSREPGLAAGSHSYQVCSLPVLEAPLLVELTALRRDLALALAQVLRHLLHIGKVRRQHTANQLVRDGSAVH